MARSVSVIRAALESDSQYATLTRNVNGLDEELTSSERSALLDEWAIAINLQELDEDATTTGGETVNYGNLRRESYPDIGDQLDAIYKWILAGGGSVTGNASDPADTITGMIGRITDVKNRIRKPS